MKTKPRTSFKAWAASLPLALGIPVVVWGLFWGYDEIRSMNQWSWSEFNGQAAILGIATLIHFLAYVVTGLPVFLCQYGQPHSRIWMPTVGIPLGAILGVITILSLFSAFDGGVRVLLQGGLYVLGGGYGTATAIAAVLQRPTLRFE